MFKFIKNTYSMAGSLKRQITQGMIFTVLKNFSQMMVFMAIYYAFENIDTLNNRVYLITALISIVAMIFFFINNYMLNRKIAGIYFQIFRNYRLDVGGRLKRAPMGYFSTQNLSAILTALTNQMRSLENYSAMAFDFTVSGLSISCFILLGIFGMSWKIGLLALAFIMLAWTCIYFLFNQAQRSVEVEHAATDKLSHELVDGIRGSILLRSFPKRDQAISSRLHAKTRLASEMVNEAQYTFEVKFVLYSRLFGAVLHIGSVVIILYAVHLYLLGEIPLAKAMTISAMGFLLLQGLLQLQNAMILAAKMPAIQNRLDEVLDIPEMTDGKQVEIPEVANIEFKDVNFSYLEGQEVLQDLSFEIPAGSKVAIVGPSGSGKTTIVNLIARFYDPDSGEILLGGKNLRDYEVASLMGEVSLVFQDVYLFNDTVRNNIRFGRADATDEEVLEAAKRANCHDFIEALPEGYDTEVGEGGTRFSGGEKQRISIARALLKDASIILLDEATSSVDPENEAEIMGAIEELCAGKTVISIAHRLSTVRDADLILVIDHGRLVQAGKHDELLIQDGIYRRFIEAREEAADWRLA
ncbi:MAG: ABC transporter ATP-binding protein [Eubacteriales bacterium]|nr:ABC transporter ATP-binding protein [Eubacteriales bacterium]